MSIELEALAAQGTTLLGELADAHGLVEEAAARVGRRRR